MAGILVRSICAQTSPPTAVGIPELIDQLASPDYADRRKAMRAVDSYLAAQEAAWLNASDSEVKEQVASALQFNNRLTTWVLEALKLPEAKKAEQIRLLTSAELKPLLGLLFAAEAGDRLEGVKKLGAVQVVGTGELLGHFLRDESPAVALAAMEAVWDRPADDAVVTALWSIGVGRTLAELDPAPALKVPESLTFRGAPVVLPRFVGYRAMPTPNQQELMRERVARTVLTHLKTPQVESLLVKSINELAARLNGDDSAALFESPLRKQAVYNAVMVLSNVGEACKFKSTAAGFFTLATEAIPATREMGFFARGPDAAYFSIRTAAIGAMVAVTDQDPAGYGMRENKTRAPVWTVPTKEAEENVVEQLKTWWKENSSHYPTSSEKG